MGMFDYVNVEIDCPECGQKIKTFQTKDGKRSLEVIDPEYIHRLYGLCNGCGTFVEFEREPPAEDVKPRKTPWSRMELINHGFTMTFTTRGKGR